VPAEALLRLTVLLAEVSGWVASCPVGAALDALNDQDDDAWWLALLSEPATGGALGILERAAGLRPAWQARAACTGLGPGRFYSTDPAVVEAATTVCAGCPVREPCSDLAARNQETFGVWGGASPGERRAWRRAG